MPQARAARAAPFAKAWAYASACSPPGKSPLKVVRCRCRSSPKTITQLPRKRRPMSWACKYARALSTTTSGSRGPSQRPRLALTMWIVDCSGFMGDSSTGRIAIPFLRSAEDAFRRLKDFLRLPNHPRTRREVCSGGPADDSIPHSRGPLNAFPRRHQRIFRLSQGVRRPPHHPPLGHGTAAGSGRWTSHAYLPAKGGNDSSCQHLQLFLPT